MANAKKDAVDGAVAAEEKVNGGNEQVTTNASPTKKAGRRGIGAARGTNRLKFSHELAKQNGLFLGHLDSVEVRMITIGEEKTGMPSFNGLEIPKLLVTFASNEEDPNKRHYVTLQFTAVESNASTIPGGKEVWKVNAPFDWMKHLLNVFYLKGRELTEEEDEALSLSYLDFDEQGEYVPIETEEVIAAWKVLFENFENIMNRGRDGQPVYKTKDGKFIAVWLKLLRYTKHPKKGWQPLNDGELAIPTFVGEGCIEVFKQNTPTSIRVNSVKEAIIPMNVEKAKAPNIPAAGMPGMGAMGMGGVPVDPMLGGNSGFDSNIIGAQAQEDMPF